MVPKDVNSGNKINSANRGYRSLDAESRLPELYFCNMCDGPLYGEIFYFNCPSCDGGDWDICQACAAKGFACKASEHTWFRSTLRYGVVTHLEDEDETQKAKDTTLFLSGESTILAPSMHTNTRGWPKALTDHNRDFLLRLVKRNVSKPGGKEAADVGPLASGGFSGGSPAFSPSKYTNTMMAGSSLELSLVNVERSPVVVARVSPNALRGLADDVDSFSL